VARLTIVLPHSSTSSASCRLAERLPDWVFNGLLPIGFGAIALVLMPIASVFQFDSDEGQELVKALLYQQNFALFTDIWSDQPPLLTVILAPWLRLWGNSVLASRLLMLGFATLLVWSFAQILRRIVGDRYALLGAGLLIFTANFLRLSVSVMIGMPAIACLLYSLYCWVCYQESGRWVWLLGSAIVAGLSLQFKMFTVLLLPWWGLLVWVNTPVTAESHKLIEKPQTWRDLLLHLVRDRMAWRRLLIWSSVLTITFVAIGVSFGDLSIETIFINHVRPDLKSAFIRENSLKDVVLFYVQELDYFVLAVLGIFATLKSAPWRWQFTLKELPIAWLIWVTFFLLNHKPIWYHHYSLVAIPLTGLATLGLRVCIEKIQNQTSHLRRLKIKSGLHLFWGRAIRIQSLALSFLLIALPIKLTILFLFNQNLLTQSAAYWQVAEQIQTDRASLTKSDPQRQDWLFTDIPMLGVYLHQNIPPEIATLSRKRIAAQEFTAATLQALIQKYDLQQFVIGRFPNVQLFLEQTLPDQLIIKEYPVATYYRRLPRNES
jgi:4-amino-4-deoxy-L-arabinose transferase-like glycosyltransferase